MDGLLFILFYDNFTRSGNKEGFSVRNVHPNQQRMEANWKNIITFKCESYPAAGAQFAFSYPNLDCVAGSVDWSRWKRMEAVCESSWEAKTLTCSFADQKKQRKEKGRNRFKETQPRCECARCIEIADITLSTCRPFLFASNFDGRMSKRPSTLWIKLAFWVRSERGEILSLCAIFFCF